MAAETETDRGGAGVNKKGNRTAVEPLYNKRDAEAIAAYLRQVDAETGQPAYILWVLCANCGYRIGDMLRLRVSDVCNKGKRIKEYLEILEEKENKYVKRKLNPEVRQLLQEYVNGLEWKTIKYQSYLFESPRRPGKPYTYVWMNERIKRAADAARVEQKVSTHTMRKTFAYQCYQLCKSMPDRFPTEADCLELVRSMLGHSSITITRRYLGIEQREIDDITQRIRNL